MNFRFLAQNAVHAAMAGYTCFSSGVVRGTTVYLPIDDIAGQKPALVEKDNRDYQRLLASTGQPDFLNE